jgi:hypothetical protein
MVSIVKASPQAYESLRVTVFDRRERTFCDSLADNNEVNDESANFD